ncbi:MAG: hypothetical protein R3C56_23380 [Pirellulaceae bacterium]
MIKPIATYFVGCSILLCALHYSLAAEPAMRLRLKDGSFSAGTVVGVEHDDQIGWSQGTVRKPLSVRRQLDPLDNADGSRFEARGSGGGWRADLSARLGEAGPPISLLKCLAGAQWLDVCLKWTGIG